jgi:hypothetical protein
MSMQLSAAASRIDTLCAKGLPVAKKLKAYSVQADECGVITFAFSGIEAHRKGANELDVEFEGVESCRRAPWADEYAAQGWVPVKVQMANGWWHSCNHCGDMVFDDSEDDDGNVLEILYEDRHIYCNASCKQAEVDQKAAQLKLRQGITDATLARWPEAGITYINDYERDQRVSFCFEGGLHSADWKVGEEMLSIRAADIHAWHAFAYRQKALVEVTP